MLIFIVLAAVFLAAVGERPTETPQQRAIENVVASLRGMQYAYYQADFHEKLAIAAGMRHQAAAVPRAALPADLRNFLETL